MAAEFISGTGDKVIATSFVTPDTTQGTMAIKWRPGTSPGSGAFFRLFDYGASGKELTLYHHSDDNFYVGWNSFGGDDRAVVSDTGLFVSGTWVHMMFTYDTAASPHTEFFVDNVSKATKTGTLSTGTGFSQKSIGTSFFANNSANTGDLAEYVIYDTVLDAGQRASLAAGFSPKLVAPHSILEYRPLVRDFNEAPYSGNALSTDTAGIADHPPIIQPAPYAIGIPVAAAGGGVNVTPGVGSIGITGLAPTLDIPFAVTPGVGEIGITGQVPTIELPRNMAPGVGSIGITGYVPTVSVPQVILPGVGAVSVVGLVPTVDAGGDPVSVSPGTGAVAIVGFAPTLSGIRIWAPVGAEDGAWSDVAREAGTWTPIDKESTNWTDS